jgi:hypothetical protein
MDEEWEQLFGDLLLHGTALLPTSIDSHILPFTVDACKVEQLCARFSPETCPDQWVERAMLSPFPTTLIPNSLDRMSPNSFDVLAVVDHTTLYSLNS